MKISWLCVGKERLYGIFWQIQIFELGITANLEKGKLGTAFKLKSA